MNSLKIFVLAYQDEQLPQIADCPHLVKINLSKLEIGEYQNNSIAEHRIYFSNLPETCDAEYVGFLTWRWADKFAHLQSLEQLAELELKPNRVYAASLWQDWYKWSCSVHKGMSKYLVELGSLTKLPLNNKSAIGANQFICHKSVYLKWKSFFVKSFNHFYKKYGWNFDYYICEEHKSRWAGAFYERLCMLYFTNQPNLEIVQIP